MRPGIADCRRNVRRFQIDTLGGGRGRHTTLGSNHPDAPPHDARRIRAGMIASSVSGAYREPTAAGPAVLSTLPSSSAHRVGANGSPRALTIVIVRITVGHDTEL